MAFPWAAENLPAILQAWYPGQAAGTAVANVLFGEVNPSGKLPLTFYRSTEDLPHYYDYNMENRTYRYFSGKPLYAFGHGLSYTQFEYGTLKASASELATDGIVQIEFELSNTGAVDGDEVVQAYVHHLDASVPQPIHSLAAFKRVTLGQGTSTSVTLDIPASALRYWNEEKGDYVVDEGGFEVQIGTASDDIRQTLALTVKKA